MMKLLRSWAPTAVLAVLLTAALIYGGFHWGQTVSKSTLTSEMARALDREVRDTAKLAAWADGYASCEQDVFQAWLNQTAPAIEPGSFAPSRTE